MFNNTSMSRARPGVNRNRRERNPLALSAYYDEANKRCAEIILANPERHGGVDAFPAMWARMFLERTWGSKGFAHGLSTTVNIPVPGTQQAAFVLEAAQ